MERSEPEQTRMAIEPNYVALLDLLSRVIAADNYKLGDRLSIARGLTNKFIEHAVIILHLSRGIELYLPSSKFNQIDCASIEVLTRTAMEAFLCFHYVFFSPSKPEEKTFRYLAYKAAALLEIQLFPGHTEKANEKEMLNKLHDDLKSNLIFQSLTPKQKKQVLKGEWGRIHYSTIAIDAGFSKVWASFIYKYLCGPVHSGMLSVVQSVDAHIKKIESEKVLGSMITMNILLANMVREYCEVFPNAKVVLNNDFAGTTIVEHWVQVGHLIGTQDT